MTVVAWLQSQGRPSVCRGFPAAGSSELGAGCWVRGAGCWAPRGRARDSGRGQGARGGQVMATWAGSFLPTTELTGLPRLPQYRAPGWKVQGQSRQCTDLGAGSVTSANRISVPQFPGLSNGSGRFQ